MTLNTKMLFLTFPVFLLIGGCFGQQGTEPQQDTSLSGYDTTMETQKTLAECKKAVEDYLTKAAKFDVDTTKTVKSGDTIAVDYIGRLEDGTVFDSSVKEVAQECGVYNTALEKNYQEGLTFEVGAGKMIAGFDSGVQGMHVGETKTVTIVAKDAYGEASTIDIKKSDIGDKPDGTDFKVGDMLMSQAGPVTIVAVSGDTVSISDPNPLAGKDLIFDITIKSIQ